MSSLLFRRFTSAYALREVDPAVLIDFLRPHAAFLAANGVMLPTDPRHLDVERVEIALLSNIGALPVELVDALWHLHEMATPLGMESLQAAAEVAGIALPADQEIDGQSLRIEWGKTYPHTACRSTRKDE